MNNFNFTSYGLTGGLYGQILTWILEVIPHLEENKILPNWDLYSNYYGHIFGKHIMLNYEPTNTNDKYIEFMDYKLSPNTSQYFHNYGHDFNLAHNLFFKYFKISDEIYNEVKNFVEPRKGKKTLGIHYRGTDKINSTESGYMDEHVFVKIVDDYLSKDKDIDTIFVISDEKQKIIFISEYYNNKGYKTYYPDDSVSLSRSDLLFYHYSNESSDDRDYLFKKSIVDPLILSNCDVLFKSQSALSSWAKIFNPSLDVYRITSFKYSWFPDGYINKYTSNNPEINIILDKIYNDEKSNC
jgi:hypothetical protein